MGNRSQQEQGKESDRRATQSIANSELPPPWEVPAPDGTALPGQVSGSLEVQAGSKLSVEDCNDALDSNNQPAVTQQWSPISGNITMSVDEVGGEDWPGGPILFSGSVSLNGVVIALDGSSGVTCTIPDTTWSKLGLGWWPG